jgi:hypothetical protein
LFQIILLDAPFGPLLSVQSKNENVLTCTDSRGRLDDPGDRLVVFESAHPMDVARTTGFRLQGKAWIVVARDFANEGRSPEGPGELSERISTNRAVHKTFGSHS